MLVGANELCTALQDCLPCLCGTTQFTLDEMMELGSVPCLMFHRMLQSLLRLRAACGSGACGVWHTPTYTLAEIQELLLHSEILPFVVRTVSRIPWGAIRRQCGQPETEDAALQAVDAAYQWTSTLLDIVTTVRCTAERPEAIKLLCEGHAPFLSTLALELC